MNKFHHSCMFIFLIFFLVLISSTVSSSVYYVKTGGNDDNTGINWSSALKTITKSLGKTAPGDSIFIAEGTYQEGSTIEIPNQVSLYGGFAGDETSTYTRCIKEHPTIIDGENSYQCVKNQGKMDGIIITNGNNEQGGGIFNQGVLSNCTISTNTASWQGGGIYNQSGTIKYCSIYGNQAESGGGIYNINGTIIHSRIFDNMSSADYSEGGGGIYDQSGKIINCQISNNKAFYGAGIECNSSMVHNCDIYSNHAQQDGGGIRSNPNPIDINTTITHCTIQGNISDWDGGGILDSVFSKVYVEGCHIYKNKAERHCGGAHAYKIINSRIHDNFVEAGTASGCSASEIINCIIYNNRKYYACSSEYAQVFLWNDTMINCAVYGGNCTGVFFEGSTSSNVVNSIIWGNAGYDIAGVNTSGVSFTCFKEATNDNGNMNKDPLFVNTTGDPSTWDFHLQDESPCIDKGNQDASYRDGCRPPGKGADRNDLGAYGGPFNCNRCGEGYVALEDMKDILLGKKALTPSNLPIADRNNNESINVSDIVTWMESLFK